MIFTLLFSTILVAILSKQLTKNESKKLQIQCLLLGIGFILFAGLRSWDTFSDTDAYYAHFNNVSDIGAFWHVPEERFETGYLIIEKFFHKHVSSSPEVFILFVSSVVFSSVFLLLKREAKNIWFPAYLIVGFYLFVGGFVCPVRQSLATAVCIWGYFALKKKRVILSVLLILLACTIHSSAICVLVIIPASFLSVCRRNFFLIIICTFFCIGSFGSILELLGRGDSAYLLNEQNQLGNILDLAKTILILILYFLFYRGNKDRDRLLVWLSVITLCTSLMSLQITVLNRTSSYFELYLFILLTNTIYSMPRNKRMLYQCALLIVGFVYLYTIYTERPGWNRVNEYHTIFEHPYH